MEDFTQADYSNLIFALSELNIKGEHAEVIATLKTKVRSRIIPNTKPMDEVETPVDAPVEEAPAEVVEETV